MLKRLQNFWMICVALNVVLLLILFSILYFYKMQNLFITICLVLIFVTISFIINWRVSNHYIGKPFIKLLYGMNKLADKDTNFRLEEEDEDDIDSPAYSFNEMASMLSSSLTELEKSRDYLRGILESSADIIITINPAGTIRTINMGVTNVLGYRRRDVIGKPIDILLADPNDKQIAAERLKLSDNVVNYETKFLTKDGKLRNILLTLTQLRNSSGDVIGTICFSKDITKEKRLQKKLMQSERFAAIGEVFTGLQHSMKNMLNACKGGSYMVRTGLAKDNRVMLEEGWEMVQEGINRLTDMSSDMLRYVKEWKPRSEIVNVSDMLSDIYGVIKQTAQDKGVKFSLENTVDLPNVNGDTKMIHSAVMDIVSNALDACLWKDYDNNEQPAVKMKAYSVGQDNLVIEIQDNGCGMTDDIKRNIFHPFFSTKSKAGTGLGLAITSRMINSHNGKIDVESQLNVGTTFKIVLPLSVENLIKE